MSVCDQPILQQHRAPLHNILQCSWTNSDITNRLLAKLYPIHDLTLPPPPPCHNKEDTLKKKYVDDMSLLESINLKTSLLPYPVLIGPRNFHELPGLYLPPEKSTLQHQLSDLLGKGEIPKKISTNPTKPFQSTFFFKSLNIS